MVQDDSIRALRQELKKIWDAATDFFQSNVLEKYEFAFSTVESDYFWSSIPETEQLRALKLEERLIEIVSGIALTAKKSPLLNEADQRDIITSLKTMRAALHFRRYSFWEPEVIHDEGTVLGIRPTGQSDDRAIDNEQALKVFGESYTKINRIADQIVLSETGLLLPFVSSQLQAVTKYRQNTAFIMMWMDKGHPELDDVKDTIKNVFEAFGIRAIRADDIEHEDVITKRILDEITTSEFLVADLSGARPSVYYEVGYAHALGKRVILFRKKDTPLHFDLAGYNCPEYENFGDLKRRLENRLQQLTNKTPNK